MIDLRIVISSPPDRNHLVAEIFFENIQWAEINQDSEEIEVEFYPRPDRHPWRIPLQFALDTLEQAKMKLIG